MEHPSLWTLQVSEDRMSADLSVSRDYPDDEEELRKAITQTGIKYGLLDEGIKQAFAERETFIQIAQGTSATPGIDDAVEFTLAQNALTGDVTPGLGNDLKIAYEVPSLQAGDLIAQLKPGKPGDAGKDIYGKSIAAPRIRQYKLICLAGTNLSDDGLQVFSTSVGRPRLDINGTQYRFQVLPVYVHSGDLTLETAHLSFDGDIVVRGSVMEGTSVSATGHVDVLGNVVGATVKAGQAIRINGNVIQGSVEAGYDLQLLRESLPLLENALDTLDELSSILRQLEQQGKLKKLPLSVLAEKVIELHFSEYPQNISRLEQNLLAAIKKVPVLTGDFDPQKLAASLNYRSWSELNHISDAQGAVFAARDTVQTLVETSADVYFSYALNSTISASGKITVKGQGSFHCRLRAGREAEITGIVRGGSIHTEKLIKAGVVGSQAGAQTLLQVGKRGSMEVQRAFENTTFIIGESRLKLTDVINRCRVILDRDGLVHLKPGR